MNQITLVGPNQKIIACTNDSNKFNKFVDWLKEYNPTETLNLDNYLIQSDNRIIMARIKAIKLGLTIFK